MNPLIKPKIGSLMGVIVSTFLLLATLGCSGMQPALTASQLADDPPPKETLVSGDEVEVKFFYTPELNEKQLIRPDGTITLQLVGKVAAQGKTPLELRNDLIKLYASQLKKPEIEVLVRNKNDRKVYVSGEVKTPGTLEMKGDLTILEAIKQSGGFVRPGADIRNVLVVRQMNGKQEGCVLDLRKVMNGEEETPFLLQPRDVVYVPPTSITKVNDWVTQYVSRMLPQAPVGFGITP